MFLTPMMQKTGHGENISLYFVIIYNFFKILKVLLTKTPCKQFSQNWTDIQKHLHCALLLQAGEWLSIQLSKYSQRSTLYHPKLLSGQYGMVLTVGSFTNYVDMKRQVGKWYRLGHVNKSQVNSTDYGNTKTEGPILYLVFCPKTTSQDISAMFCYRT